MAKKWNPKDTTSYTYESVDGSKRTIRVGEDGVTEEMILFLKASDNRMSLQDRYQEKHTSYDFRNAMDRFYCSPDPDVLCPLDQIPDPAADITRILFPEETDDPQMIEKLCVAIEKLTMEQKELVDALYHTRKKIMEIAREQNVTSGAIQNRRRKILARLRKILEENNT